MKGQQEQAKKVSDDIFMNQLNQHGYDQFREMLDKIATTGTIPKDMMGLSQAMVEGIYGQAYRLYNTGKYREAAQLFRLLVMLNATDPKYAMGLAACFHMLKEYKNAAQTYTISAIIDPDNPIPHFHASDCYIQMENPMAALIALEMALTRAGDKPEYQTLKDRALLTVESLKKQIAENPPKLD